MKKVLREELQDYQTYSEQREEIRKRVMPIKQARRIHVGEHLTFLFENHDTVHYQIQEMMRVEQIVKEADILHEMGTYNELLGDDGQLGCTLLIEIEAAEDRARLLTEWLPLPSYLYMKTEDGDKVRPRFDPRQVGDERLSSVQYLIFDTGGRKPMAIGTDFDLMNIETPLTHQQQEALNEDLFEE